MTKKMAPTETEVDTFYTAAWQNDVDVIRDLAARHPILVDPAQPYLQSALSAACCACQPEAARVLVEEFKADAKGRDEDTGMTLLHEAMNACDMVTARMLVLNGADVNARDLSPESYTRGWTPVHYAVAHNDAAMVLFLFNRGADLRLTEQHGLDAAAFARKSGRPEIAALVEQLARPGCVGAPLPPPKPPKP